MQGLSIVKSIAASVAGLCLLAACAHFEAKSLALGTGEAGREIEGPMAIVILGGLVTSTVLNLFVLPTLALRYGTFVAKEGTEL